MKGVVIEADIVLQLSKDKYDIIQGKLKRQREIAELKAEIRKDNDEIKALDKEIYRIVLEAYGK